MYDIVCMNNVRDLVRFTNHSKTTLWQVGFDLDDLDFVWAIRYDDVTSRWIQEDSWGVLVINEDYMPWELARMIRIGANSYSCIIYEDYIYFEFYH